MICYVGVGTNLGNRAENLERAARELHRRNKVLRASAIYQNPAMVPEGAPADWNLAFLNAVLEVETSASPEDFLKDLMQIETLMGRGKAARWAPRIIDLDLLLWGDEVLSQPNLQVPHPGLWERSFVLDPLKDLIPQKTIPRHGSQTVLARSRVVKGHSPLWMGILNLTPDSFSDGGKYTSTETVLQKAQEWTRAGVSILDLGAESTRPGAQPVSPQDEWDRLKEPLSEIVRKNADLIFKPWISVDTRHPEVAEKAIAAGADWLNDVSGFTNPRMMELAQSFQGPCVFMHSLTVPADKQVTLPKDADPVQLLKEWCSERLNEFHKHGISQDRLIFDPGIGFGKTELQSLEILKRQREFHSLPVPVLVGHSRKSFMRLWTGEKPANRDGDSVGASLRLIESGVEILRVHEPLLHMSAHLAWSHL